MRAVHILIPIILLLSPFSVFADSSLTHNVGNVDMIVSDWGGFTKIEAGGVYSNFTYLGKDYLDPFSEVWAGDSDGHVASAYDGSGGDIVLGEWQPAALGQVEYLPDHPDNSQYIHAQYEPSRYEDFPFDIAIDQYTYSWDRNVYPDDGDYIIMKLILTNHGDAELKDFFLAVQTNWDVDFNEEKDDLVDWDSERRAGIAYDSNDTNSNYVALALIGGKVRSHNIVDVSAWKYLDSDRSALMSNGEMDDLKTIRNAPANYFNVISTGPYTIPAGESVSAVYAFAVGQSLRELQESIDSARMRIITPDNLAATPGKDTIKLTWSPAISEEIAAYKVYRSVTGGVDYSEIAELSPGDAIYLDTDVEMWAEYYYVVTAIEIGGNESGHSNEVHSSAGVAPPPPENLIVRSDASANPVLHWEPPTDAAFKGYKVFRNFTGSDPWTPIATLDADVQSFVDQNVYGGNTYYYVVASTNGQVWTSEYSNVVSIAIDLTGQMEAASDLSRIKVFPNPCKVSSEEKIRFTNLTPRASIYVYTPSGELVNILRHTDGSGEAEWDLRNMEGAKLASGVYIYHVESYKTEETGKFTVSGKFALVK